MKKSILTAFTGAIMMGLALFTTDAAAATTCKAGEYKSGSKCLECPAGYYCKDEVRKACPAGKYQDQWGQSECKSCPANSYTDVAGSTTYKKCTGANQIVNAKHTACESCKTGQQPNADHTKCEEVICKAGEYKSGNKCLECTAGYYCKDGARKACPAGKYQAQWGQSECKECVLNSYTNEEGSTTYKKCTGANQIVNAKHTACEACKTGYIPNSDHTACEEVICKAGEYKSGNKCLECPAGYYCKDGARKACPAGKYQDQRGQSECKECVLNSYTDEAASTTYKKCTGANQIVNAKHTACESCKTGQQPNADHTKCEEVICKAGEYKSGNKCLECPAGYYCKDGARKACPAGKYQDQRGQSECKECVLNSYTDVAGSTTYKKCTGANQIVNAKHTACESCKTGQQPNADHTKCENKCPFTLDKDGKSCLYLENFKTRSCGAGKYNLVALGWYNYTEDMLTYQQFVAKNCLACPKNATCNGKDFTCKAGFDRIAEHDRRECVCPTPKKTCTNGEPTGAMNGTTGCVTEETFKCANNEVCNTKTGVCEAATSKVCQNGYTTSNGCVSQCSYSTGFPYFLSDPRSCVTEKECTDMGYTVNRNNGSCIKPTSTKQCDEGAKYDESVHQCVGILCYEKKVSTILEESCAITADERISAGQNCWIVRKKITCSGDTPVCNQQTGQCEKCPDKFVMQAGKCVAQCSMIADGSPCRKCNLQTGNMDPITDRERIVYTMDGTAGYCLDGRFYEACASMAPNECATCDRKTGKISSLPDGTQCHADIGYCQAGQCVTCPSHAYYDVKNGTCVCTDKGAVFDKDAWVCASPTNVSCSSDFDCPKNTPICDKTTGQCVTRCDESINTDGGWNLQMDGGWNPCKKCNTQTGRWEDVATDTKVRDDAYRLGYCRNGEFYLVCDSIKTDECHYCDDRTGEVVAIPDGTECGDGKTCRNGQCVATVEPECHTDLDCSIQDSMEWQCNEEGYCKQVRLMVMQSCINNRCTVSQECESGARLNGKCVKSDCLIPCPEKSSDELWTIARMCIDKGRADCGVQTQQCPDDQEWNKEEQRCLCKSLFPLPPDGKCLQSWDDVKEIACNRKKFNVVASGWGSLSTGNKVPWDTFYERLCHDCLENATCDGTHITCKSGYAMQNNQCVAQTTDWCKTNFTMKNGVTDACPIDKPICKDSHCAKCTKDSDCLFDIGNGEHHYAARCESNGTCTWAENLVCPALEGMYLNKETMKCECMNGYIMQNGQCVATSLTCDSNYGGTYGQNPCRDINKPWCRRGQCIECEYTMGTKNAGYGCVKCTGDYGSNTDDPCMANRPICTSEGKCVAKQEPESNRKAPAPMVSEATQCANGKYLFDGTCWDCPQGAYCTNGQIQLCPVGTYNEKRGATSQSSCKKCKWKTGEGSVICAPPRTKRK